jgi:hypothetical protein
VGFFEERFFFFSLGFFPISGPCRNLINLARNLIMSPTCNSRPGTRMTLARFPTLRLALRKRRGDGAKASLGMVSTSSKPSRESHITAATSVAEAQLLLEQAIASTREATAAATQAAAAARAAQLAAEEAAGTATTALATLAAVSGKDPCRIEVDAWISPPARVARPRSTTPVVDNAAIVAAGDITAGSSSSHRGHAAEGSGSGLAMGVGLAAPVAEEGLAGLAAASDAACAPTAAEEQALAALSDAWEGVRPAHIPVPLPPDVETVPSSFHGLTLPLPPPSPSSPRPRSRPSPFLSPSPLPPLRSPLAGPRPYLHPHTHHLEPRRCSSRTLPRRAPW